MFRDPGWYQALYHKHLLHAVWIHPALRPNDVEMAQLTSIGRRRAGFLNGVCLQ